MPERDDTEHPDLEGVRRTSEDVGSLPVPRSVVEDRTRRAVHERPVRPFRGSPPAGDHDRAAEARLRRALPHAARTPEELGRALSHLGPLRRDPQQGHEGGPPLPGEPGLEGDGAPAGEREE
jgi:hypothetical protein